jgi:hypothetical protein
MTKSMSSPEASTSISKKLMFPITRGSSFEPSNKKIEEISPEQGATCGCLRALYKKWSHIPIAFSQENLHLKDYPHRHAMVISCVIKGFVVHNVLVDTGSATDIIFPKAF